MTKLDEIQSSFSKDLDDRAQASQERTAADLQKLREQLRHKPASPPPPDLHPRLADFDRRASEFRLQASPVIAPPVSPPIQAQVSLHDTPLLRILDEEFFQRFDLAANHFDNRLRYPTEYCFTLEEFWTPVVETLAVSPQNRQAEIERQVSESKQRALKSDGGGTFGYNLPGKGCYLNGWLFVYRRNIPPLQAFLDPALLGGILRTAIHEKLGHGFLTEYSALGRMNKSLGLLELRMAQEFGIRQADDALSSLRRYQSHLAFFCSQVLEEGWSTWIANWLPAAMGKVKSETRHSLGRIAAAIDELPRSVPGAGDAQTALFWSLGVLFIQDESSLSELHQAMLNIDASGDLDDYFSQTIGQPLRYAVGELLMIQAEQNSGAACLPFLAIIAANVTFDFDKIGAVDLKVLLNSDPRLYPDARLAALSRLQLKQPGSVHELAARAQAELNFSLPLELQQSLR